MDPKLLCFMHHFVDASNYQISAVSSQVLDQNKFLKIFHEMTDSFKVTRKLEIDALKKFATDFDKILSNVTLSSQRELTKFQSAILQLRDKNDNLRENNQKLEQKIKFLLTDAEKAKIKADQLREDCVTKSSYRKCEINLLNEKRKYQTIVPKVSQINKSFQTIKSSLIFKLIQAYKTYKNLYNIKVRKDKIKNDALKKYRNRDGNGTF